MSLLLLAALVVGGIAGVVLLVHGFGWTGGPPFADSDDAAAAFAREHAERAVREVMLADDRRAALLATDHGTGFVMRFGRGTVVRWLRPEDIATVRQGPAGLTLKLRDDGAPNLRIAMADPDRRAAAATLLKPEARA